MAKYVLTGPETVIQVGPGEIAGNVAFGGGQCKSNHEYTGTALAPLQAAGDLKQPFTSCLGNSQIHICLSPGRSLHSRVYLENLYIDVRQLGLKACFCFAFHISPLLHYFFVK